MIDLSQLDGIALGLIRKHGGAKAALNEYDQFLSTNAPLRRAFYLDHLEMIESLGANSAGSAASPVRGGGEPTPAQPGAPAADPTSRDALGTAVGGGATIPNAATNGRPKPENHRKIAIAVKSELTPQSLLKTVIYGRQLGQYHIREGAAIEKAVGDASVKVNQRMSMLAVFIGRLREYAGASSPDLTFNDVVSDETALRMEAEIEAALPAKIEKVQKAARNELVKPIEFHPEDRRS